MSSLHANNRFHHPPLFNKNMYLLQREFFVLISRNISLPVFESPRISARKQAPDYGYFRN